MQRLYKPIVWSCVHSQRHIGSRGCDRTQDIVRVHGDYRYNIERRSRAAAQNQVAGSLVSVLEPWSGSLLLSHYYHIVTILSTVIYQSGDASRNPSQ